MPSFAPVLLFAKSLSVAEMFTRRLPAYGYEVGVTDVLSEVGTALAECWLLHTAIFDTRGLTLREIQTLWATLAAWPEGYPPPVLLAEGEHYVWLTGDWAARVDCRFSTAAAVAQALDELLLDQLYPASHYCHRMGLERSA